MTGIHHTAPTVYLQATRREAGTDARLVRRPGRLLVTLRDLIGGTTTARLPRWTDVDPASAAR